MSDIERGGLSVEDGLDSKNAFREAYAAAEVSAATEAGLLDEQPRDPDTGQFVAADADAVEAPVTQVETADERDARIAALEARLAEKDEFIGRQSSEIGQLRQTVDERFADVEGKLAQPLSRQPVTADLIDRDPARATQLAYEQGDTTALAAAYEAWEMENPGRAAVWVTEQRANEREQTLRIEFETKQRELEARLAPIQTQNEEQTLKREVAALPEDTRTFLADATVVNALAAEFPTIGKTIVSGSPQERIEAVKALHDIHRGRVSDTLTRTAQDTARETAEAAQAARDDAYVASSTASQEQPKTLEQVEQEKAVAAFTRGKSVWDDAFVNKPDMNRRK